MKTTIFEHRIFANLSLTAAVLGRITEFTLLLFRLPEFWPIGGCHTDAADAYN